MQYNLLSKQELMNGLQGRMRDLEIEHYSNSIYITECEVIGSDKEKEGLLIQNAALEARYAKLEQELKKLEAEVKAEANKEAK